MVPWTLVFPGRPALYAKGKRELTLYYHRVRDAADRRRRKTCRLPRRRRIVTTDTTHLRVRITRERVWVAFTTIVAAFRKH